MATRRPPDVETVAITFADDSVGIMSFITTEYSENGTPRWSKAPTDENIQAEIDRSDFGAEKKPIKTWRRIVPEAIPQDREKRHLLRDDGKKLHYKGE